MRLIKVLLRAVLRVLAVVYGAVTRTRNALYDRGVLRSVTSELPVISVGNITVGGNGKTPLCLWLVEQLRMVGYRPVILSRGYGGRRKGPYRVQAGDLPGDVGDEPLLLAERAECPVYIARSRAAGAARIAQDGAGDVIVLDDGFQHRKLRRDVDIVSIFAGTEKAVREFVAGALLPFGRFREAREAALKRASLVVISDRAVVVDSQKVPPIDERLLALLPSQSKVFRAVLEFAGVTSLSSGDPIKPQSVHALAAIANPEGFFASLERVGFSVVSKHAFPDHHPFVEEDVRKLMQAHPEALFLCTEKDAVKLRQMSPDILARCAEFRVRLKVSPADAFLVAIQREIKSRMATSVR